MTEARQTGGQGAALKMNKGLPAAEHVPEETVPFWEQPAKKRGRKSVVELASKEMAGVGTTSAGAPRSR